VSNYKHTLNLPKTDFPMRGNLAQREPETLARWEELDIYNLFCTTAPRMRMAIFTLATQ